MLNGGSGTDGADRAFQPCVEMMLFCLMELELEQVMLRLGAGYNGGKEEIDALSYRDESSINEEGIKSISIPAHLHQVLLGPRTKAFMAKPAAWPAVERTVETNDKSTICADCGASTTITGSLANTTDVVEEGDHSGYG